MFALFPFRFSAPQIPKIASLHVAVMDRRAVVEFAERSANVNMKRRSVLVDMTETENL